MAEMLRQWSVQSGQALVEPEPEPGVEELWEQEMERLWSSQALVRELPYAMVDKRLIRWVPQGGTRWGPDGGGGWSTDRMHLLDAGGSHPQWEGSSGPWHCSAWPGGHSG